MGALYGETINIYSPLFARLTDDQAILTQAVLMRLNTKRGSDWSDPEYGYAISDLVNEGLSQENLARIPVEVALEVEKDERIASCTAVVSSIRSTPSGAAILLSLVITPVDGPSFSLTLSINDVSVELLTRGAT